MGKILELATPNNLESLSRSAYWLDDVASFSFVGWKILSYQIGPFSSASEQKMVSPLPDMYGMMDSFEREANVRD